MKRISQLELRIQCLISVGIIVLLATICFYFGGHLAYRTIALIMLLSVSILAMLMDILPVLLAALSSALIWNFFFIPPRFTFHIDKAEDVLMFSSYFVVALVNAVLTFKIKKEEEKSRDKEEKENALKLYNTLLNSLSHELRTPIATILGAVDTLKENENLAEKSKMELLTQIDIASIRLNGQVENLLNMSRLESGLLPINRQWTDVNELIHRLVHKFSEPKSHQFEFSQNEQLPICKLDGGLLEQILQNIFANALHYTPNGSTILIVAEEKGNFLLIDIKDNGPGIAAAYLDKIFDKFYRLPHSKTGGTGLGLSIVKGCMEALKGQITVENLTPNGLHFLLKIPIETSYLNQLSHE